MSLITEDIRGKAEVYHGHAVCQEKSKLWLTEMELPNGLLPLHDIEECGYVRDTGFVWLKQKKKTEHKFEKIGRLASYGTEVTAFLEKRRAMNVNGVKTKELLIWINACEMCVDGDPSAGTITVKSPSGLYRSFPASAFVIEEPKEDAVQGL